MSQNDNLDFAAVLATAVHDMKNSLFMLLQSIDTLSADSENDPPEKRQQIATLHYEASRLNSGLMQILALYRYEREQLPINIAEHFVFDILEEQVGRNQTFYQNKNVEISLNVDPDLTWYFDGELIAYLINDILVNALRYTKDKVRVTAKIHNMQLEILVEDNGQGYPDEMLKIGENTLADFDVTRGRTGLGLFFAKKIAAAHEIKNNTGHISLKNGGELGGSQFMLTLP
ncbi:HAMP domain-containing sensor histidine kinase [Motilimonas sp. 1_MG-2023]|uniref:sensor histidine kinase n=1 Tax=Motilimonas sp. 1_MG-2023 TaxID=3062672 RepID=UPI0026E42AA1|nr:HAMP domain-containing sensor histidine kinase [Motilimonas sp. 1_MG-2023]MDO6525475.1 HAMP domain-containing sensor histidine kinase [Motilimonas sp. 1_MG-2023]